MVLRLGAGAGCPACATRCSLAQTAYRLNRARSRAHPRGTARVENLPNQQARFDARSKPGETRCETRWPQLGLVRGTHRPDRCLAECTVTSPGPGSECDLTSVTTCSVKEAGCARAASFNPSTRCRPQRDGVRLQRGAAGSWIWVAPLFFAAGCPPTLCFPMMNYPRPPQAHARSRT